MFRYGRYLKTNISLFIYFRILAIIFHFLFQVNVYSQDISVDGLDTVMYSSDGLSVFKNFKGKWGVINAQKKIIVQPKYEIISDYNEGLAFFWVNLHYNGYLDKTGREVHKGSYNRVSGFEGGLGEVWLRKIGQKFKNDNRKDNPSDTRRNFLDHSFTLLIPYKYDSIATYQAGKLRLISRRGKYGFLDQKAQEIIPLVLDDVDLDSNYYWGEYRRVRYKGNFGFINVSNGQWFIKPKFENTLSSTSSITWVKDILDWHLINQEERQLTKEKYTQVRWVVPGILSAAKNKHGFVLIDSLGKQLTSVSYDEIFMANEGISVVLKDGKYGYIDEKGHKIVDPVYEKASYFHDGKGFVFGKYAYLHIDRNGRETIVRLKPSVLICGSFVVCLFIFAAFKLYGSNKPKKTSI